MFRFPMAGILIQSQSMASHYPYLRKTRISRSKLKHPERLMTMFSDADEPTAEALQAIFECDERSLARTNPKASEDMKYTVKAPFPDKWLHSG